MADRHHHWTPGFYCYHQSNSTLQDIVARRGKLWVMYKRGGHRVIVNTRGDLIQRAPGVPFGISFLGQKWSEEKLIGMAYVFEQQTLVRNKLKRHLKVDS